MEQPYLNEDNDPRKSNIKKLFFGTNWKIPETKKSRRTERGDLIEEFIKNLNEERVKKGFKPVSIAFLSSEFSMRKMSNHQIYAFLQDCKRAKNFSAFFWWSMKNKNEQQKNN